MEHFSTVALKYGLMFSLISCFGSNSGRSVPESDQLRVSENFFVGLQLMKIYSLGSGRVSGYQISNSRTTLMYVMIYNFFIYIIIYCWEVDGNI